MIIIKNTKKDSEKKHVKDIKIFLKKKKRKDINITWNLKRSYLTLEEIII